MNPQLSDAVTLDQRGNTAAAIAGYEQVLAQEPGNIDALFLLGRAHCVRGELERGAELLGKAVSIAPNYGQAHNLLGMALSRLGRNEEALASFERAVAADPANIAAVVNRGDALADLDRHAEAVTEFEKALALDPRNVAAWCNRGNALQALERDAEAVESFGKALVLDPNLVAAHFNMANALDRLERHEEAIARYRRAIALKPDMADAYINLASPLMALERWQEAVECSDRALELRPNAVQAHCNRGQALFKLERHAESAVNYRAALAIDPDYVRALSRKSVLDYVLGRFDESLASAGRMRTLDPSGAQYYYYLLLADTKRFASGDPEIAEMEKLVEDDEAVNESQRKDLHFSLGKIYDSLGEPERSFRHLVAANALQRRQSEYDEAKALALIAETREIYTAEFIAGRAGHGDPSTRPIFIVGMPRSGSTLLEQILAGHPRVQTGGERRDFQEVLIALKGTNAADVTATMTPEEHRRLGAAYLERATASMPPSDRFTDKMLGNIIYAGLIHLALPNARIIWARRNPVDCCFSSFSQNFEKGGPRYVNNLGELGRYYRATQDLGEHWRRVLPPGVMIEVQYEDVVSGVEAQARRILDFCGLEWNDACLAFHKVERPVMTASAVQVRQPLYRTSVGRWRPYAEQLKPLFDALGLPELFADEVKAEGQDEPIN